MACTITNLTPLGHPCTPQMGGLKYVYLAVGEGNGYITLYRNSEAGVYLDNNKGDTREPGHWGMEVLDTGAPLQGLAAYNFLVQDQALVGSDLPVYRIALTRQQAVITSEATVNRENNTVVYANSAVIPTLGLTPEAVNLVRQLGTGGVVVIGETYDGRLVAFGFEERATLSGASITTGAAFGDNPGATITLTANESIPVCADACWGQQGQYDYPKDQYILKILTDLGYKA